METNNYSIPDGDSYGNFERLATYPDRPLLVSPVSQALLKQYQETIAAGKYPMKNSLGSIALITIGCVAHDAAGLLWMTPRSPTTTALSVLANAVSICALGLGTWQMGKMMRKEKQEYHEGIANYGIAVAQQKTDVIKMSKGLTGRVTHAVEAGDSSALDQISKYIEVVSQRKLDYMKGKLVHAGFRKGDVQSITSPLEKALKTTQATIENFHRVQQQQAA